MPGSGEGGELCQAHQALGERGQLAGSLTLTSSPAGVRYVCP